ncbi:MAG: response regulator [Planctomycetota bacterium]|jgi:DNA-binding NarL/FixJ family response regulator
MPRSRPATPARVPTTVLLVDDHRVVREGLRRLLEQEKAILIVGEAENGRQAVRMAEELDPDVVLMDIAMPKLNGLEATKQIKRVAPRSRVLILSAHGDDTYVNDVLALGAVGFILKQSSLSELGRALLQTAKGKTYFTPKIRSRLRPPGRGDETGSQVPHLSVRESEVLQMIAEGRANKETALELGISIKTVEKHRQRLMSKLSVHDVAGLVRYAVTTGVIDCRRRDAVD